MLLVGSRALKVHFPDLPRECADWDFYASEQEWDNLVHSVLKEKDSPLANATKCKIRGNHLFLIRDGQKIEITRVAPGSSSDMLLDYSSVNWKCRVMFTPIGEVATADIPTLVLLKLSCADLFASKGKTKHKEDLEFIQSATRFPVENYLSRHMKGILELRIQETEERLKKKAFFDKYKITRFIEHDDLHQLVADQLNYGIPHIKKVVTNTTECEFTDWLSNRDAFIEEALVLALERDILVKNVYQKKMQAFSALQHYDLKVHHWLLNLMEPGRVKDHPDELARQARRWMSNTEFGFAAGLAKSIANEPRTQLLTLIEEIRSGVRQPLVQHD